MTWRGAVFALLAVPLAGSLQAQAVESGRITGQFSDAQIAAVRMPALAFDETAEDVENYEKYFYFHRPETGFDEAYADIVECDALSSGVSIYRGADDAAIASAAIQYGVGPAMIGGAIASVLIDAVVGSAERRKARRLNMRTCMYYKAYDRYGLRKDLWQEFNFDEGNGREDEDDRSRALLMQARVASSPRPQQEVLAP